MENPSGPGACGLCGEVAAAPARRHPMAGSISSTAARASVRRSSPWRRPGWLGSLPTNLVPRKRKSGRVEMLVDLPPRPTVSGKVAGAPPGIAAVVATQPSPEDEEMEDEGEGEVGEVEAAYTKVLGEEDPGDQAAPAPPPTPPSTTSPPTLPSP